MGVQKLLGVLENMWDVLLFGGGLAGEWKLSWGIFPWGLLEGADSRNNRRKCSGLFMIQKDFIAVNKSIANISCERSLLIIITTI